MLLVAVVGVVAVLSTEVVDVDCEGLLEREAAVGPILSLGGGDIGTSSSATSTRSAALSKPSSHLVTPMLSLGTAGIAVTPLFLGSSAIEQGGLRLPLLPWAHLVANVGLPLFSSKCLLKREADVGPVLSLVGGGIVTAILSLGGTAGTSFILTAILFLGDTVPPELHPPKATKISPISLISEGVLIFSVPTFLSSN